MKSVTFFAGTVACMLLFVCTRAQHVTSFHIIDSVLSLKSNDTDKIKILEDYAFTCAENADSEIFTYRPVLYGKLNNKNTAPYTTLLSSANNIFGTYFMLTGKYDSATRYYSANIKLGTDHSNKLIVTKAYNNLGNLENHKSNYELAVSYFQNAIKYAAEIRDSNVLARSLGNIANSYVRLKQYDKAVNALKEALPIALSIRNKRLVANLYNSMATAYGELKNDSLELAYQQRSYDIYKEINNTKGLGTASLNLGAIYLRQKKLDEALKYTTESIAFEKKIDDMENLAESYQYLCDIHLQSKKYAAALGANDSGINFALQTGDKNLQAHLYHLRAEVLYHMNDFKSAYEYQEKFKVLNDSIFSKDMASRVAEMETKYETAKKEETIIQQELALSQQKNLTYGIGALLLLVGVLGYSYFRRKTLEQKAAMQQEISHQQDLATKAVLAAEENERNRIASDLHDGVGQTLTAAKMNLSAIESQIRFDRKEDEHLFQNVINLVAAGCKEVRTVSHNMMPNTLLKSGFAAAIKEFINHIDSRVIKVQMHTTGLDTYIEPNTENVLYRVVQECVNNVIKHASANHLDISLMKDNNGLSITVEDNGKGFDTTGKTNHKGIGLKNIETRIKYLNGTVEWSSTPGKGTIVAIHVPA